MARLRIEISHRHGEGWPVSITEEMADGAARQVEGRLVLDLQQLAAQPDPLAYGIFLGQTLFSGALLDAFARAQARNPASLSVALQVDDPALREVHWGRLCAPFERGWDLLRFDQRTPFWLHVPSPAEHPAAPMRRRDLRALILVASPAGLADYRLDPFDGGAAVLQVRRALDPIPADVLADSPDALGQPSLENLCAQLTARQYAIVHIVCHGTFEARAGDTVLYLADAEGDTQPVSAGKLLRRLSRLGGDVGLPGLFFVSACESAAPAAEGALDALAPRLCRELGIDWVLAMDDRVSVDTVMAITAPFYRQLGTHGHPDLALAEACSQVLERRDLAVPVLYGSGRGTPLFQAGTADARAPDERAGVEVPVFSTRPILGAWGTRFAGRTELLGDLLAHLGGPTRAGAPPAALLVGAAGIGKTRVAAELVARGREDFPGGVFWLNAADALRREDELHAIVRQIDPGVPPLWELRRDRIDVVELVAEALPKFRPGQPKLWVLDDVPDPAGALATQARAWCPAPRDVCLLATSRARASGVSIREFEVEALAPDEASAMLRAGLSPDALSPAEAAELVRLLGGVPLALEIAGKSLALGDTGAAELIERLAEGGVAALEETRRVLAQAGVAAPTIAASLKAAHDRLPPEARRLLQVLVQFGPEPLPEALVKRLGRVAERAARVTLAARSFVTGPTRGVYGSLNRLVIDLVRPLAGPEDAGLARAAMIQGLSLEILSDPARGPELDALAPHAEALWARMTALDAASAELPFRLAALYRGQRRPDEAHRVLARALALAEAALGVRDPMTLALRTDLGIAQLERDEIEAAVATLTTARALAAEALDPEHPLALNARYNLGRALVAATRFAEGIAEIAHVAAAKARAEGPDAREALTTANTLLAAQLAAGALDEAERLARELVERSARALGPEHRETLLARNTLTVVLERDGRLREALPIVEAVVADAERLLGPEHADTLGYLCNLARLRRELGEHALVRPMLEDLLAVFVRRRGAEHTDTLQVEGDLASVLSDLGELERAERLQEHVYRTMLKKFGADHGPTALALGNLATIHHQRDRGELALAEMRDAHAAALRRYGPNHPETRRVRANLAHLLFVRGDLDEARAHQEEMLAEQRANLGEEHVETASTRRNLALVLDAQGEHDAAAAHHAAALATSERLSGPRSAAAVSFKASLAQSLYLRRDLAGARALQEEVLRERRWGLGGRSPLTLLALHELGNTLAGLGDLAGACACFEEALAGYRATLPPAHRYALATMRSLALVLHAQGQHDMARHLLQTLVALVRQSRGDAHPETLNLAGHLARIFAEQGDLVTGRVMFAQLAEICRAAYGPNHPDTFVARLNEAMCAAAVLGPAAFSAALTALRGEASAVLPAGHPVLATIDHNLQAVAEAQARNNPSGPQ